MARRNERKAQPLGIDGVVVVGFASQQTVRALGDGLGKQTAAVASALRAALPELEVLVSAENRDPYTYL